MNWLCLILILAVLALASWGASNRWFTPRAHLRTQLDEAVRDATVWKARHDHHAAKRYELERTLRKREATVARQRDLLREADRALRKKREREFERQRVCESLEETLSRRFGGGAA